jgi:hypothetical protein
MYNDKSVRKDFASKSIIQEHECQGKRCLEGRAGGSPELGSDLRGIPSLDRLPKMRG